MCINTVYPVEQVVYYNFFRTDLLKKSNMLFLHFEDHITYTKHLAYGFC